MNSPAIDAQFPIAPGILFGVGLGGFFDGIVLHQLLQWHHMLSQWYPPDTLENLRLNTLWDGIFHSTTCAFVVIALCLLWRQARTRHLYWSARLLIGTVLIGFSTFNTVEGLIDHHLLGIHHVNESVSREHWIWWDLGFLAWGAGMLIGGWALKRSGLARQRRDLAYTALAGDVQRMRASTGSDGARRDGAAR